VYAHVAARTQLPKVTVADAQFHPATVR